MPRRQTSFASRSSIITLASLLAISPCGVSAQEVDDQTSSGRDSSEEDAAPGDEGVIVVTAQFREQRLQDTPISITAISGEALEARNQKSIIDIAQSVPNVNLSQASSFQSSSISAFIRGVGQEEASFALEPGVGIYVDDVYYGTTFGGLLDLLDVDRVEVLRGPQGTLAGKNSLGGAIKIFSRRPDGESEGQLQATYGQFDRIELKGTAGFALSEALSTRVSGIHRQVDGFFKRLDYGCVNPESGVTPAGRTDKDCEIGTDGGQDVTVLRGALRFQPSGSNLDINITADFLSDKSGLPPTKTTFASNPGVRSYVPGDPSAGAALDASFVTAPGAYTSYGNYNDGGNFTTIFGTLTQVVPGTFPNPPENSVKSHGLTLSIEYELSDDMSITSLSSYRSADGVTINDVDSTALNVLKQDLSWRHKQLTQEVRLNGSIGSRVDYTIGGFFYSADDRHEFRIQIPTFLFDFLTNDPVDNESLAAFVHGEFRPLTNLGIVAGLRYTRDNKVYQFGRTNPDGSPISGTFGTLNFLAAGLDDLTGTFEGERVDYRLGANYHFSTDVMAYAQVATGYKGGGVNSRPSVADQVVSFEPETLTTYEAGLKAVLFDGLVQANASAFYNEYRGIQRSIFVCPWSSSINCSVVTNAGDGISKGAEIELFIDNRQGFSAQLAAAHLDFDYSSTNPFTFITEDMKAPFHSSWQVSAGAQYDVNLEAHGTITPRIDWSYQSGFFYQALNSPNNYIGSRHLVNARLTYSSPDERWKLSGSVTNLFDNFYDVAANDAAGAFGFVSRVVGRPREWLVTVTRSF